MQSSKTNSDLWIYYIQVVQNYKNETTLNYTLRICVSVCAHTRVLWLTSKEEKLQIGSFIHSFKLSSYAWFWLHSSIKAKGKENSRKSGNQDFSEVWIEKSQNNEQDRREAWDVGDSSARWTRISLNPLAPSSVSPSRLAQSPPSPGWFSSLLHLSHFIFKEILLA